MKVQLNTKTTEIIPPWHTTPITCLQRFTIIWLLHVTQDAANEMTIWTCKILTDDLSTFLDAQLLRAMSSPTATYGLVTSPYLTPAENFIYFSFAHLTWNCSTPMFYWPTMESILTGSSAAHKSLNFSTHTGNVACWVTRWSLSLCTVHCPYGHCHFATYHRSAVTMISPGARTALHQNHAAASHSCHSNTVMYPRSYSECQLPLNTAVVTPEVPLSQFKTVKCLQSQQYLHRHLFRPANRYKYGVLCAVCV
jgi:hypothetical protein